MFRKCNSRKGFLASPLNCSGESVGVFVGICKLDSLQPSSLVNVSSAIGSENRVENSENEQEEGRSEGLTRKFLGPPDLFCFLFKSGSRRKVMQYRPSVYILLHYRLLGNRTWLTSVIVSTRVRLVVDRRSRPCGELRLGSRRAAKTGMVAKKSDARSR